MKRLAGTLVLFALLVVGCGSRGVVKGKVSFKNEPLKFGTVSVQGSDGTSLQAAIDANGDYEVTGVPLGKAKFFVYVANPAADKVAADVVQGKDAKDPGGRVKPLSPKDAKTLANANMVPKKYSDFSKELLTHEITSGENKFDIKLEP